MKTRFNPKKVTPPSRVEAKKPANKPRPLIFNFSPDEFRGMKGLSTYKIVYLLAEDRLVIGPEWIMHRKIAQQAFGSDVAKSKSAIVGAMLNSRESNGKMCFNILGKSGFYGLPAQEHLRQVAQHIAGHLESVKITELNNAFLIEEE